MTSLGDKLIHLSLEIEDRTKSAELLRQLVQDQSARHESEVAKFEKEQDAILQKLKAETEEMQTELSRTNESLIQRKKALEREVRELSARKKDTENAVKKNLDEVRREIAEAKESAYSAYKQERSQREKAWFDGRAAEINKLTWKGVSLFFSEKVNAVFNEGTTFHLNHSTRCVSTKESNQILSASRGSTKSNATKSKPRRISLSKS